MLVVAVGVVTNNAGDGAALAIVILRAVIVTQGLLAACVVVAPVTVRPAFE